MDAVGGEGNDVAFVKVANGLFVGLLGNSETGGNCLWAECVPKLWLRWRGSRPLRRASIRSCPSQARPPSLFGRGRKRSSARCKPSTFAALQKFLRRCKSASTLLFFEFVPLCLRRSNKLPGKSSLALKVVRPPRPRRLSNNLCPACIGRKPPRSKS